MVDKPEYLLGDLLRSKGWQLAAAESCTGGLISPRITNVAGSSDYYLGGVTAYAYEAKEQLLGVLHETITQYGAVSQETVVEMAAGVRSVLGADISISASGIAGPGGRVQAGLGAGSVEGRGGRRVEVKERAVGVQEHEVVLHSHSIVAGGLEEMS